MDIEKHKESMPRCKDCTGFGWGECKTAGENEVACEDFERKPKLTEVLKMDKRHIDKPQQLCDKLLRMIQECDEVINGDTNEPATVLDGMTIFEFRTVLQSVLFYLRA